jgi:hypothetical protein
MWNKPIQVEYKFSSYLEFWTIDKVQKPSDSDTNTIIPMNSNLKLYLLVLNTFQTYWLIFMGILLLQATSTLDM